MSILKIVFVIIGTLIGAGFASGQEVYAFFFSFGFNGLFGIFISSAIIGLVIYKTFCIVKKNNTKNYKEFLNCLIKSNRIKDMANIIVNIFILTSFYIMITGFGAYLNQEYGINTIFGSAILAFFCLMIFKSNINSFVRVNEVLIPILISVIVFIRSIEC